MATRCILLPEEEVENKTWEEYNKLTERERILMFHIGFQVLSVIKSKYREEHLEERYIEIEREYKERRKEQDTEIRTIKELCEENTQKRLTEVKQEFKEEKEKYEERIQMLTERMEGLSCKVTEERIAMEKENMKLQEALRYKEKEMETIITTSVQQTEMEYKERINELEKSLLMKTNHYNDDYYKLKEELYSLKLEKETTENKRLQEFLEKGKLLKSSKVIGDEGQIIFQEMAMNVFRKYEDFEITETSKTSHKCDFHLKFSKFSILADTKSYKTDVGAREREKIRYDMKNNPHIKVAWIVSLNTAISKFANYPFMLEIEDGRCYIYINSLLEQENPERILEQVWYTSHFIHEHVLNNETEMELLNKYKKNEMRVKKLVEKMMIQNREGKALLKQMKENFEMTEKDLLEVVNNEIMSLYEKNIEYVKKWWTANTEKK